MRAIRSRDEDVTTKRCTRDGEGCRDGTRTIVTRDGVEGRTRRRDSVAVGVGDGRNFEAIEGAVEAEGGTGRGTIEGTIEDAIATGGIAIEGTIEGTIAIETAAIEDGTIEAAASGETDSAAATEEGRGTRSLIRTRIGGAISVTTPTFRGGRAVRGAARVNRRNSRRENARRSTVGCWTVWRTRRIESLLKGSTSRARARTTFARCSRGSVSSPE